MLDLGQRDAGHRGLGDANATEVGVKFTSDAAGTISGIRFWKTSLKNGTHVGSLWTASGTLLASATFSGETSSGWQQVNFSTPVSISANTTYVAGYFAPKGHYSSTSNYFFSPPPAGGNILDSPPLHVPGGRGNGPDGLNGVYAYAPSSTFPSNGYHGEQYWVDVIFNPAASPTPPGQVTGVSATAGTGSATVRWSAPTSGGAPTSYKVTPYIGSDGADGQAGDGLAASDDHDHLWADCWAGVHVHGAGVELGR